MPTIKKKASSTTSELAKQGFPGLTAPGLPPPLKFILLTTLLVAGANWRINADEWGTSNVIKLRLFHILKPPNPLFDSAQSDGQAERSRSLFLNLMTLGAQILPVSLFRFYLIRNSSPERAKLFQP